MVKFHPMERIVTVEGESVCTWGRYVPSGEHAEMYTWGDKGGSVDEEGRVHHNKVIRWMGRRKVFEFRTGEIALMKGNEGDEYIGHIISMYEGIPKTAGVEEGSNEEERNTWWVDFRWLYSWAEVHPTGQRKAKSIIPDGVEKDLFWSDHVDPGINQIEVLDAGVEVYQVEGEKLKDARQVRLYYDHPYMSVRRLKNRELRYLCENPTYQHLYHTPFGEERKKEWKTARKTAVNVLLPGKLKPVTRVTESSRKETDEQKGVAKNKIVSKLGKREGGTSAIKPPNKIPKLNTRPPRTDNEDSPLALKERKSIWRQGAAKSAQQSREKRKVAPGRYFTDEEIKQLAKETEKQRAALNPKELEMAYKRLLYVQKKMKQEFRVAQANGTKTDTGWMTAQFQRILHHDITKVDPLFRLPKNIGKSSRS